MSDSLAIVKYVGPGKGNEWEREARLAVCAQIQARVALGVGLKQACAEAGVARSVYQQWLARDEEIWNGHVRARMDGTHALADEALELARTPSRSLVEAQDKRTYLDTVKWICAKVHPRAYGDPRQLEMAGTDGKLVERAQQWQIGKRSVQF